MAMHYKIFSDKYETAKALAEELYGIIAGIKEDKISMAVSGGTTPYILFDIIASEYGSRIEWRKIHFYWVDERCVSPLSHESNYGNTKRVLFENISIPQENIHRIRGEEVIEQEVMRYSDDIFANVPFVGGIPQFNIVLLGMGDDGHTASIFPNQLYLMKDDDIVSKSMNPYNKQERITLTGNIINHAQYIFFLVTGSGKSEKVNTIFNRIDGYLDYPAAHINPVSGKMVWYLDREAGSFL